MDAKAKTDPRQAALDSAATQIMDLADKFMLHMGMRPGDETSQTNQTRCLALAVDVWKAVTTLK